jgi:hypothetical protein
MGDKFKRKCDRFFVVAKVHARIVGDSEGHIRRPVIIGRPIMGKMVAKRELASVRKVNDNQLPCTIKFTFMKSSESVPPSLP